MLISSILQTVNRYHPSESFLEVSPPLRRTSSLPDIIENRLIINSNENNTSDSNESKCNNDCNLTIPSNSAKDDLTERRKSFFIDMNSNPKLQITAV